MKLNEQGNTVKRAIAIAGIVIAATTGCSKNEKKETSQNDEHIEMVKTTRRSIKEKDYETTPWNGILEGKPIALPRPLVEKAKAEGKLTLPRQVNDIGPLAGVPVEEIDMEWTGRVSRLKDLSPLKGAPLKKLNISYSLVDDIEALRGLPLEEVNISSNLIRDLSPLKGAKLKSLDISCVPIESLEPLRGMPLEEFSIVNGNCPVSFRPERGYDFSPLEDAPLKKVRLHDYDINISFLKGKPIEALALGRMGLGDLRTLKGMPIRELDISGTLVKTLEALKGMPIRELDISATQVADLEPLRGMQLKKLTMYSTPATDLSPLADLPLDYLTLNDATTDLRPIKDLLDRLRKKEYEWGKSGLSFFSMRKKIDWDTYQLVDSESEWSYPPLPPKK